jgi:hypothetical protein
MKRFSLLIFTTLSFLSPKSQQLSGNSNFDNYFVCKAPRSSNGPESNIENQAKWKLVFKTSNGKVFESPIDKMRCTPFNFKAKCRWPVLL